MKSRKVYVVWALLGAGLLATLLTGTAGPSVTETAAQSSELPSLLLVSPIAGLTQPVSITHAGDGSGRLFVVQQSGQIRIIRNGTVLPTPFLNISTRISTGGERGLLGLAFPPGFATKQYFYVNYTNSAGNIVIARYRVSSGNADIADFNSEQVVLTVNHPVNANHNGGQLAFSQRDGFLYIGTGDGGGGGDTENNAQNGTQLLGKILRIDVETGSPATYTVPASNPFVGTAFRPEIWALGMRNPWRFSFDRQTNDLFVGDVGQGAFEEVNFQPAASTGGVNYGWRIMEGIHCFNPSTNCNMTGLTLPVTEYNHGLGCSITGGYVYRGPSYPRMVGLYFYGDFCSGRIWSLRQVGGVWQSTELLDTALGISTFGEDEMGNLYVANYNNGTIFSVTDNVPMPTPTPTPTPIPSPTPITSTVQFSAPQFQVTEDCTGVIIGVTRTGDLTASQTVGYVTNENTANQEADFTYAEGNLVFASGEAAKSFTVLISEDAYFEGTENLMLVLRNPAGGTSLGNPNTATLTITDDETANGTTNPIDDNATFVAQHYHDFLNREGDAAGLAFWKNQIDECTTQACREIRRINVSAAFFLSIEFRQTGFLVYKANQAAFNSSEQLRLQSFLADTQEIGRGVIIGQPGADQQLNTNKQNFFLDFVQRPAFRAPTAYPTTLTAAQFVDKLNGNTFDPLNPGAGALTQNERDMLVALLLPDPTSPTLRAQVLRSVSENGLFTQRQFNKAFVLMQYFGYLRRNPDGTPDTNFDGYNFWLAKLNQFNGNFVDAEMIKAFLQASEFRKRFWQE